MPSYSNFDDVQTQNRANLNQLVELLKQQEQETTHQQHQQSEQDHLLMFIQ
jgi:uncharacterized protein YukE